MLFDGVRRRSTKFLSFLFLIFFFTIEGLGTVMRVGMGGTGGERLGFGEGGIFFKGGFLDLREVVRIYFLIHAGKCDWRNGYFLISLID